MGTWLELRRGISGFQGLTATATVFSPTAAVVLTFNANSQQQLTLSETGTYIVQVRASNFVNTGSYSLGLQCPLPSRPVLSTLPKEGDVQSIDRKSTRLNSSHVRISYAVLCLIKITKAGFF